ncbi:MAG TPA: phage antirepressor KilAC domain-containing protein, partial [Negativicutes bacterium]
GLGFVETAGSGNEVVRWARVRGYLSDLKFIATSGDAPLAISLPEFIPENIFYRLAMKAKNETAEKFQAIVADEILPAIRKTGTYSVSPKVPQTLPEALRAYAIEIESHIKSKALLESQRPMVVFAESVECSKTSILVKGLSVILKQNGIDIGQNRLFEYLRNEGYLCRQHGKNYNKPTQRSLELRIMEEKTTTINKPDRDPIITNTPLITGRGQIYFVNKFLNTGSKVAQA